jgi:hypothetical protein
MPARAFYSSRLDNYNESQCPTSSLGAGQTLCCRAQQLGVANNVFNVVGMPDLVIYHPAVLNMANVVVSSCRIVSPL